jgi:transposase
VPAFLEVTLQVESSTRHGGRGRPLPDAVPESVWRVQGTVRLVETALAGGARRKASFIVASNVPATRKSAEEVLRVYKAQSGVERGFAFLKDPLFLASSVFVKKVERVMATGFIMVLCLLVYRLAEHRIRQRLAETGATVTNQRKQTDTTADPPLAVSVFRGHQPGPDAV